jgi:hypothetical protein
LRMLRISLFASLLLVMAWMIKKENFPSVKSSQNPLAELYCKTGQYKGYQLLGLANTNIITTQVPVVVLDLKKSPDNLWYW